ncbi:MAG: hypothetical protein WDN31_17105 [Hyphomicrobium sp.]
MELFGLDSNPVPEGAFVGSILASDGVRLRYAYWRATGRRQRGTICLFQGRTEAIEKYFEVIGELRERGFAGRRLRLARPGRVGAPAAQPHERPCRFLRGI